MSEKTGKLQKPRKNGVHTPASSGDKPTYSIGSTRHTFVRRGHLHPRLAVESNGIDLFTFKLGSNEGKIWIYSGTQPELPPLACLTLSGTLSSFQIYVPDHYETTRTNAKARVGYPHPKAFSFETPDSLQVESFEWQHQRGGLRTPIDATHKLPIVYTLLKGPHRQQAATMTIHKKSGRGTTIAWHIQPESEQEQAFLILSAIGVLVRIRNVVRMSSKEAKEFWGWGFGSWYLMGLNPLYFFRKES